MYAEGRYNMYDFSGTVNEQPFRTVSAAAAELGVEAYVVGGYVRDLCLRRKSKDIDVMVVGSGIEIARTVARMLGRRSRLTVFKTFGTAQVINGEYNIEFVGARKESYNRESRKPIVEDGSLADDLSRRDFTIKIGRAHV